MFQVGHITIGIHLHLPEGLLPYTQHLLPHWMRHLLIFNQTLQIPTTGKREVCQNIKNCIENREKKMKMTMRMMMRPLMMMQMEIQKQHKKKKMMKNHIQ